VCVPRTVTQSPTSDFAAIGPTDLAVAVQPVGAENHVTVSDQRVHG